MQRPRGLKAMGSVESDSEWWLLCKYLRGWIYYNNKESKLFWEDGRWWWYFVVESDDSSFLNLLSHNVFL